jgi:hypothetical protein
MFFYQVRLEQTLFILSKFLNTLVLINRVDSLMQRVDRLLKRVYELCNDLGMAYSLIDCIHDIQARIILIDRVYELIK